MKYMLLAVALLLSVVVFSCSNSDSPVGPNLPTITIPGVGTNWTLQNTYLDSTGKTKKTDTSVRTIMKTGMAYQGFTDVVMIVESFSSTGVQDTVFIRYLLTGDISRLSSPSLDPQIPQWFTVPYYTHTAQSVAFGGNISLYGYTHDSITFNASYVGDVTDTVGSQIYTGSTIQSTTWHYSTSASKDSTGSITQQNTFIPSQGIFGGRTVSQNTINSKQVQRIQQRLLSVVLK